MTDFTETCSKSYDRHTYTIVFDGGREQLFGDYETMRNFWFQHCQLIKMTVKVNDVAIGFA